MKNKVLFPKIFLLLILAVLISSCIKNDNLIEGDAKVRYFQSAVTDTTQNFFLNGIQSGASTTYGSNSNYIVVAGDSTYAITSRNINTGADVANTSFKFGIGANYSIFYTRTTATSPPVLKVYQDDVKQDLNVVTLNFLNLGYTLGSDVIIKDDGGAFTEFVAKYGEKSTHKVTLSKSTHISFALQSPIATQPLVLTLDSLPPTTSPATSIAISKGLVYYVLLDGSKKGELQMRLVSSN